MHITKLLPIAVISIFISATYSVGETSALKIDDTCSQVELIFARGSGQSPKSNEAERFREQVESRIKNPTTKHYYELGTETYGGHKYEAINVGNVLNGNPIGAKASSGYAFDYGKSVDSGVGELYNYLEKRNKKCPNARIVLGGYSQGAQVIGQTLPKLSSAIQNRIVFNALFGDPKLHLPEGEGIYPDACRGKNLSSWRRAIGDCHTDNGSLGARKPYLANAMTTKTGLWCNAVDFVCGTSKFFYDTSGHGKYKLDGGAIDKAAIEIAQKIKTSLPTSQGNTINTTLTKPGIGTTGSDVAFILNASESMGYRIEETKKFIRTYAKKIIGQNGRVALIMYDDGGGIYTPQLISELQSSPNDLIEKLDSIQPRGVRSWASANLHAVLFALNELHWKQGATKTTVLLTDTGLDNMLPDEAWVADEVVRRSLEIDPVNVYPVVPSDVAKSYETLATKTSGQVIEDKGDTNVALTQAFNKIDSRPTALLKNAEYSAEPGQEITFDASDSYVVDASIAKYEWDMDGDNAFEYETLGPTIHHTYDTQQDGIMQVRLTASNNTVANASAPVKIGTKEPQQTPKPPVNIITSVLSTKDQKSTISLSWSSTDTLASKWIIAINGVEIGYVTGDRGSLELTDIDRTLDVELSVTGVTIDNELGESGTTMLTKYIEPPVQPPTTASGWLLQLIECARRLLASLGILI